MAIWKCPECGGTKIKAYEWDAVRVEYDLNAPYGWDIATRAPGDEANILMAACCEQCTRELTNDELAQIAGSIDGLVLPRRKNPILFQMFKEE